MAPALFRLLLCIGLVACAGFAGAQPAKRPSTDFNASRIPEPDPAKGKPLARVYYEYLYDTPGTKEASLIGGFVVGGLFDRFRQEQGIQATSKEVNELIKALKLDAKDPERKPSRQDIQERREFAADMVRQW